MDEAKKHTLRQQFNAYLEIMEDAPVVPDEQIDLMHLFRELSGLRNEVRLESRQLKRALDDFREAFTALDNGQQELVTSLKRGAVKSQASNDSDKSVQILGLIDLYDRILAALRQTLPEPGLLARLLGADRRYRQWDRGYRQGQEMVLKRIESLLAEDGVTVMDVLHKPFDPQLMEAVDVMFEKGQKEGVVLEEQRTGFLIGDRVLRTAEVVVNKKGRIT